MPARFTASATTWAPSFPAGIEDSPPWNFPMAVRQVSREIDRLGGRPVERGGTVTDNGNRILDVHGLVLDDFFAVDVSASIRRRGTERVLDLGMSCAFQGKAGHEHAAGMFADEVCRFVDRDAVVATAEALEGIEDKVIVLTGAGDAFCSGQDLGGGRSLASMDVERTLRDEYIPMLKAIADTGLTAE